MFIFQAVLKQFGAYGGSDNVGADDAEFQQHQKLEKLYISTRAGKVTLQLMLICVRFCECKGWGCCHNCSHAPTPHSKLNQLFSLQLMNLFCDCISIC